jgi:hypothetical protein
MANQYAVPSLGQGAALSPQPTAFPFKTGTPPEGPKSALISMVIPPGVLSFQLGVEVAQFGMSMVQSLLVDNEGNNVAITVKAGTIGTNFGIQPGGTQIIPVFQTGTNLLINVSLPAVQATATVIAFQIFNAFVPPASWVSNLSVAGNVNIAQITGTVNVAVQGTTPVSITGGVVDIATGNVTVTSLQGGVSLNSSAAGGAKYVMFNPLTNVVQSVKASSAGTFKGMYVPSPAAAQFIQVFDALTAAAVTLGVTVPNLIFTLPVDAAGAQEPVNLDLPPEGLAFLLGIQIACTLTATGAGAVAAPPIVIVYYA